MKRRILLVSVVFMSVTLAAGCERQASFAEDIQPILDNRCVECHGEGGEGMSASQLDLRSYEGVMAGTGFGPVVVPGSPESSALYLVIAHATAPEIQMPPHHADALAEGRGATLNEDEVGLIRRWIAEGAANN